ncbi:hypothetical protein FF38_07706 [Lucilia cuprina]|uniref:Uncharacterized protein n=1 Tax=Lucilia cuprina TaxID=7375 RepID=A0A0L0BL92_LUCCU|nr:hypothetical protein FF38_07706 [Lucilia cuprina]
MKKNTLSILKFAKLPLTPEEINNALLIDKLLSHAVCKCTTEKRAEIKENHFNLKITKNPLTRMFQQFYKASMYPKKKVISTKVLPPSWLQFVFRSRYTLYKQGFIEGLFVYVIRMHLSQLIV